VEASAIAASGQTAVRVHEVPTRHTPVSPADIRTALAHAYQGMTGHAATPPLLDVLTAQASLETGRGGKMNNYNFGGIKGAGPGGATARYLTREVGSDASEHHLVDGFRAYSSLACGAADYLQFLKTHYSGAFDAASRGDVDGFAAALKQHGYFTENVDRYASALRGLVHDDASTSATRRVDGVYGAGASEGTTAGFADLAGNLPSLSAALATAPDGPAAFPTTSALARVMDEVASMCSRVGAPLEPSGREKVAPTL
jgi:hypothetical protein